MGAGYFEEPRDKRIAPLDAVLRTSTVGRRTPRVPAGAAEEAMHRSLVATLDDGAEDVPNSVAVRGGRLAYLRGHLSLPDRANQGIVDHQGTKRRQRAVRFNERSGRTTRSRPHKGQRRLSPPPAAGGSHRPAAGEEGDRESDRDRRPAPRPRTRHRPGPCLSSHLVPLPSAGRLERRPAYDIGPRRS